MRSFFQVTLLSIGLMMLSGCNEVSEAAPPVEFKQPAIADAGPIRVATFHPEQVALVDPINLTGTVLAIKSTSVVPLVGGLVEEVFVRVGDRVKEGQPLLRMRQSDFQIKVDRLTHSLRLAEAERRNAKGDLDHAQALVKKSALSREQLDDRRTRYELTTAQVGIARANLAEAHQELSDSTTKAPFDGVVTQRNVDEGAYVPAIMRTGQPVMEIQKIDIMVAVVFVPETYLRAIHLGTPGKVTVPGLGKTFESVVHLINDRIDAATRSIDVRLGIPNADYAIKPGLFIEVELTPDPRLAMTIPTSIVKGLGGDRYVYVEEQGKAHKRSIEIRELADGQAEVLSGLAADDNVIGGPDLNVLQDQTPVLAVATL